MGSRLVWGMMTLRFTQFTIAYNVGNAKLNSVSIIDCYRRKNYNSPEESLGRYGI